ncbi:unnamed protein product [Rhodiola kirilowii]
MAKNRDTKNEASFINDAEEQAPAAAINHQVELEHQVAAIRAIRDIETNRLLTSLQLLRSYFTEEQLQTPLLEYFEHQLPNLSISGNGKEEELNVNWKTDLPRATADIHESLLRHISLAYPDTLSMSNLHFSTNKVQPNSRISSELQFENSVMNVLSDSQLQTIGFQDGLQTPGGTGNRISFGMTPKTLRLPNKGEILLSVHGSPLGVYREKEDNMEVINAKHSSSFSQCQLSTSSSVCTKGFVPPLNRTTSTAVSAMGDSSQDDASNTLRILIATDCHLGYMEKDEIRRHDSFQAFEEICSIADKKQVDFLLLGGDLFHENKPSRSTLVKAIEILRHHCMNDRPVQFQVVSDQASNFANKFGHVNYEDPSFTVGLPVFSIHGNHDDPAGVVCMDFNENFLTMCLAKPKKDNLSAVDILSACNLVNYFGKMILEGSGVGQINLSPILIKKGLTSVAMYGLGNIRDERLNRMFQPFRVKSNPKNDINEHFLPQFLDFVVWGHEHECLIDPQEIPGMGFHVTQPGSSVATSLIDGESKPKHVLLLEIKGSQYRPTKIPLQSVRPFEYTEVVLKDVPDIDPNDQTSILEHLDKVVNDLIENARRKEGNKSEPKLPLVRIKVDYSGFMTINPQKFGQKYVGKVANPQDILIFSKAPRKANNEGKFSDAERLWPEELNQQNIEALVAESNLKMEILPVNDLDVALHNFVNKDDKMAFYTCVRYNIEETRNKIAKDSDISKFEEDEDLILKVGECLEERVKSRSMQPKDPLDFTASAQSMKWWESNIGQRKRQRMRKGQRSGNKQLETNYLGGIPSASAAAASAVQSIANVEDIDSASSDETVKYDVTEVADSSENEEPVQAKGRKRAAPKGKGKATASSSKQSKKTDSSSIHNLFKTNSDDDDDDDDEDDQRKRMKVQPRVTRNYGAVRR